MEHILVAGLSIIILSMILIIFIAIKKQGKRMKRIIEAGQFLETSVTMEEVFAKIQATILQLFQVDIIGIATYHESQTILRYDYACEGLTPLPKTIVNIDQELENADSPEVYTFNFCRDGILLKDIKKDLSKYGKHFTNLNPDYSTPVSAIFIPMTFASKTVAILTVQSRSKRYSQKDLQLLREIEPFFISFIKNAEHHIQLSDIVERKTKDLTVKNNELQQSIKQLKQTHEKLIHSESMASLGRLVAGIAHEINTPVGSSLTGITCISSSTKEIIDLVGNEDLSREELDTYLDDTKETSLIIEKELRRASELIGSFKQVSADRGSEIKREFNVREHIDNVLTSLRNILKKGNIHFTIEGDISYNFYSYPGSFSQILNNLILNALNHAFDKTGQGKITITYKEENGNFLLIFSDNGKGIPKKNLKHIFDPFFTTASGTGGTGLGLNILYNIVTVNLSGTVLCTSSVGKGTQFEINMPIESSDEEK